MKLRKSKKTVRVLSLILAVAMLMSAMMVQAFGITYQDKSGSVNGYWVSAYIRMPTSTSFRCTMECETRMLIDVYFVGAYINGTGDGEIRWATLTTSINDWEGNVSVDKPDNYYSIPWRSSATLNFWNDGRSTELVPQCTAR